MGAFFLASRADRGRGGFNGHVTQGTSPRLSTPKLTGSGADESHVDPWSKAEEYPLPRIGATVCTVTLFCVGNLTVEL
jgi:hypothetical protein